jgi:hypothetical protein
MAATVFQIIKPDVFEKESRSRLANPEKRGILTVLRRDEG